MTEIRRPPACHFDRTLGIRVTRDHRDDCPDPTTHRGCAPCTAPHCVVCNRTHATNDHPQTCPECLGKIRTEDLGQIPDLYAALYTEATEAGGDGRLTAAAPIPGGTAQVLTGPTTSPRLLKYARTLADDHRPNDPIPPLAVLAQWEDMYRIHLDHGPASRVTVSRACGYLATQLDDIAQDTTGPDFLELTRQLRRIRSRLEHVLHDSQEPERGVECFECGDQLVRRFRTATRCQHSTPARTDFARWMQMGYPEALTGADVRAARRPCGDCNQGGIDDPRAGLSWECPGCRKEYDPGEYATAVRRDLLEGGPDGDGWTHIAMAAEAATMMTGVVFGAARIRRWVDRGLIASRWSHGERGLKLVRWIDVRDRAADAVRRAQLRELERRREAVQEQSLWSAVERGDSPEAAGERLGVHPARVEKFVEKWEAEARA